MLNNFLSKTKIAYPGHSKVASQEMLGRHFFHDVNYAHRDKWYGIVYLERSRVGQQDLHSVCKGCFELHNCRRYNHHFT